MGVLNNPAQVDRDAGVAAARGVAGRQANTMSALKFETLATHVGQQPDPAYGAVIPPIYQTSTFAFEGVGKPGPFDYTRTGNPTRKALEDCLAALEGGRHGFAFSSGMAAVATVFALLSAGDHAIVQLDLYGGTYRLLTGVTQRQGVEVEFVDLCDLEALAAAFRDNTKLVWAETPTNPLMRLLDLRTIADLSRENGVTTACDNTFLSPYFQRPLEHGIDVVVHSTTKYINGHSDVVGGAHRHRRPAARRAHLLSAERHGHGAGPARRLPRLARRQDARRAHGRLTTATPWPSPATSKRMRRSPRCCTPASRAIRNTSLPGVRRAAREGRSRFVCVAAPRRHWRSSGAVRLFTLAESLGGVESLIEHPATMTHAAMPADVRRGVGITDDLIRISVGLEHVDDLIADLEQALASTQRAVATGVAGR